jgi:hypothetical protein
MTNLQNPLDRHAAQLFADPEMAQWLNADDPEPQRDADPYDIWVPLSPAQQSQAEQFAGRFAAQHPNPEQGAIVAQNVCAVAALANYLQTHGVAVDLAASNSYHMPTQLACPETDLVLPGLGTIEAVVLQDAQTNPPPVTLGLGRLAYGLVQLVPSQDPKQMPKGARLRGVILARNLPHQGMATLSPNQAQPWDQFWQAQTDWQQWQRITAQAQQQEQWSANFLAEVVAYLDWVYQTKEAWERPAVGAELFQEHPEAPELAWVREDSRGTPPSLSARQDQVETWMEAFEQWHEQWQQSPLD